MTSNQECIKQFFGTSDQKTNMSSDLCDESILQAIKRQLDIHERLNNRFISGELSQSNIFCRHLDTMRETRKSLINQLDLFKKIVGIRHQSLHHTFRAS